MDISKINDVYIMQCLNNTVQNKHNFCNADQSITSNKVLLAMFHHGTSVNNLPIAYELSKKHKNNAFAAYISIYAQYGEGVPKSAVWRSIFDKALAFHQIEKSAKADDKYGQYINLGTLYETEWLYKMYGYFVKIR